MAVSDKIKCQNTLDSKNIRVIQSSCGPSTGIMEITLLNRWLGINALQLRSIRFLREL